MLVYSSTQHPTEVQHEVAHALGVHAQRRHRRVPADGRRLRRQGDARRRMPACAAVLAARGDRPRR